MLRKSEKEKKCGGSGGEGGRGVDGGEVANFTLVKERKGFFVSLCLLF